MNYHSQKWYWKKILFKIVVLHSILIFSYGCVAWLKTNIDLPEIQDQKIKKAKRIVEINQIKIEIDNNACSFQRRNNFLLDNISDIFFFPHVLGLPHYSELSLKKNHYKFKFYHKHSGFLSIEIPSKTIYYQVIGVPIVGSMFAETDAKHYCGQPDKKAQTIAFSNLYEKLSLQKKYLFWEDISVFYHEEVKSHLSSNPDKTIQAINAIGDSELQKYLSETLRKNSNLMLSSMDVINNQFNNKEDSSKKFYNNEVIEAYKSEQSFIDRQNPIIIKLFTPIIINYCNDVSQLCQIMAINKKVFIAADDRKNIIQWDKHYYIHLYNKNKTKEDYLQYYKDYPDSYLRENSLLEWAKRENTEASYLKFFTNSKDKKLKDKAKELYEPILFSKGINDKKSIKTISQYIIDYPKGKYISKAKKHREKVLFNISVKNKYSSKLIESYIYQYPKGKYIKKAKAHQEKVYYNIAVKNKDLKSCNDYLRLFQKGRFKNKIKQIKEKVEFDKAVYYDTLNSYENFISNYPNGKYTKKARALHKKVYSRLENRAISGYNNALSYSGRNDVVTLTYTTESYKKAFEIIDEVKEAMQVRDPAGFFNPYWITSCPEYGAKGYKGIVIGEWYTYNHKGFSNWKVMLKEKMSQIYSISSYNVNTGSSSYSSGSSSGRTSYSCYMKNSYYTSDSKCGTCSNNSESVCCVTRGGVTSCSGPKGSYGSPYYEESLAKACGCY